MFRTTCLLRPLRSAVLVLLGAVGCALTVTGTADARAFERAAVREASAMSFVVQRQGQSRSSVGRPAARVSLGHANVGATRSGSSSSDDPRPAWEDWDAGPPPGQWTEQLPDGVTKGTDGSGQFCLIEDGVCVPRRTEGDALASEWTLGGPPPWVEIDVWPTTLYRDEIIHFDWVFGPAGTTCQDYFGNVSLTGALIGGQRGVSDQPSSFTYYVYCWNDVGTVQSEPVQVTVLERPPPNSTPNTPTDLSPADNYLSIFPAPELSAIYSDPDGDPGHIFVQIFDGDGHLVRQGPGSNVSSGGRSIYMAYGDLPMGQVYFWYAWSVDNQGNWSPDYAGPQAVRVNRGPNTPSLVSPAAAADVPTAYPALSALSTDPDTGSSIYYRFRVYSDASCATLVDDSDWLWQASTYRPAAGKLKDGTNYFWRVQTQNSLDQPSFDSECRQLNVRLNKLGLREQWPTWAHGPLAVNEATGNLVLALPGPSYSTAAGSMSASVSYNSLAPAVDRGLGSRWALAAGDEFAGVPVRMVDHSLLSGVEKYDAVERVSEDGGSDYYTRVGVSNTYLAAPGDGAQLSKNGSGWTLTDPDGAIYTFGTAGAGGVLPLLNAEYLSADKDKTRLTYCLSSEKVTSIRDVACAGATPTRELKFSWRSLDPANCTGALLCITGPDDVAWKYVGDGANGESGKLVEVHNGTRTIARVTYGANGLPEHIRNANDLNPGQASPGYAANHSIEIGYDGSGRVQQVSEPGTANVPVWTFAYFGATNAPATQAAHDGVAQGTARPAAGSTTMTPPRQQGQPSPKTVRVYYDTQARTIATTDQLGNTTQVGYNARDLQAWSEDEDGNPTDSTYNQVNDALLSVKAPDPDGAGSLARPETRYGYDEITHIGGGQPLVGVQAAYYDNPDLVGRPKARQTDATVAFSWTTGGPAVLAGQADNFSVRWSGELQVATAGKYTFSTVADDGTRLVVDGALAIDRWSGQASTKASSAQIQLTAGSHKLVLEYRELTGSASARLLWACTTCGIPEAVVPSAALRPAWLNPTSTISPLNRISFSHYQAPERGLPDYSYVVDGSTKLITSFEYDAYGRSKRKVMPKGNAARTISAGDGALTGTVDSHFATDYSYYAPAETAAPPPACGGGSAVNQAELLKTTTPFGLAPTTFVYDGAGRSMAKTNGAGTTCSTFDDEGRLLSANAPGDAQPTTYQYDPAGARRTATDASGTVTSEYDEAGRVKRSVDSYGAEARLVYDLEGNITQRTAAPQALGTGADQVSNYTAYDEEGRLLSLVDPAGRAYAFTYDRRGNLRTSQYPNGTFAWQEYNAAGWLTAVYNRHGTLSLPPPASAPGDASPIADYTYTYDLEGRKTQEVRTGGGLSTETTGYGYDTPGRLQSVALPSGTQRSYQYDLDSNRTAIVEGGQQVATYTHDANTSVDRLTSAIENSVPRSFGYDTDGNMTQRGSDMLSWDGWGRHTGGTFGGTTVDYAFDPLGFRRSRTGGGTTRRYLQGGLFETDGAGALLQSDVDGPQADLAVYDATMGSPPPLSASNLTKTASGSDAASYSTASVTPAANRLLLATVINSKASAPDTPTVSGNGLSWVQVATRTLSNYRMTTFRALGATPTAGAVSASFGAAQTGAIVIVDSVDGVDTGGTNGSAAVVQSNTASTTGGSTSLTVALGAFADPANASYGTIAHNSNTDQSTAGSGFTELADSSHSGPMRGAISEWRNSADTTVDASWVDAGSTIGIALELKQATSGSGGLGTPSFRYYNGHGDLAAETDPAGTRTTAYTYDPFGTPREMPLPTNTTTERWTGRWDKKLDTASALVEMGARPFDPALGRFIAVDPVDAGSANAYDYAYQDPVNVYDLDGKAPFRVCIWGLGGGCSKPIRTARDVGRAIRDVRRAMLRWEETHPNVTTALSLLVGAKGGRSGRYDPNQAAIIALAKTAQRTGVSRYEFSILQGWAREYGLATRGPEIHPTRPGWGGQHLHGHIGSVNHIPVRP